MNLSKMIMMLCGLVVTAALVLSAVLGSVGLLVVVAKWFIALIMGV